MFLEPESCSWMQKNVLFPKISTCCKVINPDCFPVQETQNESLWQNSEVLIYLESEESTNCTIACSSQYLLRSGGSQWDGISCYYLVIFFIFLVVVNFYIVHYYYFIKKTILVICALMLLSTWTLSTFLTRLNFLVLVLSFQTVFLFVLPPTHDAISPPSGRA